MSIRVLLADDQAMVRAGFSALLEVEDGLEVCGEAGDGYRAVELARQVRPDVVLMDVRMPRMDGIEATRAITADPGLTETRVVVLTTFELDEYVFGALRAGASGFLLKNLEPADLLRTIRIVAAGESLLAPQVTTRLIEAFVAVPERSRLPAAGLDELTSREREILELVALGLSNVEIADRLWLSPLTVKTHVSHVLGKLGARDRVQLVVAAYESGLVVPGQ
ncbi:MAG: Two-component transcriptional response regulator, LuxR family [uncultured Solirubrobacteraceae bacterium]|uniref:Two-component transcriptional response regulator, LuxR family n=1 Tax=uncultured Solirubrobacteraceae bacterium TaxID=1162706 RepID=A0A6J4RIU4_9ACTN|nr:MAG: Two-component transcriptional response regulator, LuxR family [uncultured Solirubrobacteraceae bacterium]